MFVRCTRFVFALLVLPALSLSARSGANVTPFAASSEEECDPIEGKDVVPPRTQRRATQVHDRAARGPRLDFVRTPTRLDRAASPDAQARRAKLFRPRRAASDDDDPPTV
ncbi:MAG: hypothetical protein IT381_30430 [Deltaproteobacteria bacterium]|nr:hypothetical protein [Deltaproteobacteria bacterium]